MPGGGLWRFVAPYLKEARIRYCKETNASPKARGMSGEIGQPDAHFRITQCKGRTLTLRQHRRNGAVHTTRTWTAVRPQGPSNGPVHGMRHKPATIGTTGKTSKRWKVGKDSAGGAQQTDTRQKMCRARRVQGSEREDSAKAPGTR